MENINKKTVEEKSRVRFNDYTEYNSEKSSNGGGYGFWTDYINLGDGKWEISYGTTAELPWCPCCGDFSDHDPEETCGGFKIASTNELLEEINKFNETEDEYIEFFESEDENA